MEDMSRELRSLRILGETQGLTDGMKQGEQVAYTTGYFEENARAYRFGIVLGAAKALVILKPDVAGRMKEMIVGLERDAVKDWIDVNVVEKRVEELTAELKKLGIHLEEE